ncbi:MAG: HlyD family efflux transporter periplasmic adaptor subunit [Paracoccaceae bacterium]
MRYSRLVIGFVLIVLALWVVVSEQMAGASADAVVNARLSTLRAPIAGTIVMQPRALGSSVSLREEIAAVTDSLVDSIRLNDLVMDRGFATAELERLTAQADTVAAQSAGLAERGQIYHAERLAEIEVRLSHAQARLALLEAGVVNGGTLTGLVEAGQSGNQGDPPVAGVALEYARERVDVIEIALRAAKVEVFLGDGYNDAPYSEQRRNELEITHAALLAGIEHASARLATLDARIGTERQRTTALGGAALASTVNGQVWEVLAANGETVQRGQDVLRLLDCDAPMVTVSVTESTYNRLTIGDAAVFRLTGHGSTFAATVIRLAGSGAATVYQNLAVAPSQRHLERYDVALLVPALQEAPDLRCAIGRTGRVFFDTRPLDWLRNLWR